MKALGAVLVVLGILALAYGGFSWTRKDKVIDAGPIEVTADKKESIALPPAFADGMFVGEHGSWNRRPRSGYVVVFVPFTDGRPSGRPIEVLGGFLDADGHARGRPVGVALDFVQPRKVLRLDVEHHAL